MEIHDFLQKTRITRSKFAKMIRVSTSALYKYLNKEREPSLAIAMSIVEASGGLIDYSDLLIKRRKKVKSLYEIGEYADRQVKYGKFENVDEWDDMLDADERGAERSEAGEEDEDEDDL